MNFQESKCKPDQQKAHKKTDLKIKTVFQILANISINVEIFIPTLKL